MRVLYLFNKVLGDSALEAQTGQGHDSWLFGMLRLPSYGITADFLEIEKFLPKNICRWLRKYVLTMHYAHLPLLPWFFKYDVVFTSTAYGCLFVKALLGIKKFKWIILDFNILGTIQEKKTLKQKLFYWSIVRGVDGIVAISQAEAEALKIKFPHLAERIIFLHEATDTAFFKPQDRVEKNQIVSVGNYGRDFDTLIEAVKDLDVELLLATKLISPTKAKMLPANVKVVMLNHQEMVQAYAESKIVAISLKTKDTYFDSVGTLSLGEALSMGKATVVTHTKSMESYVQNNVNGIFVAPKDVIGMRQVMVELLGDEAKRRQMGERAREFAIKYLDPEVFAERLAIFLKNVV